MRCYVFHRVDGSDDEVIRKSFAAQKAQIALAASGYVTNVKTCRVGGVFELRAIFTRDGGYPTIVLTGTQRAGEGDVAFTISPPGVPAMLPPEPQPPPCG